jgi:tRNA (Thr-GGU) A37 N-methylase
VGVFATRSPHRPNPVGLTLARVEAVDGDVLRLSGVDLLDGTPVIDIKPYIPLYDSPKSSSPDGQDLTGARHEEVRVADWVQGPALRVAFTERVQARTAWST